MKICFVCLGNICRSPMAEFVMKDKLAGRGWQVESRATSSWEQGNPIHPGTRATLERHGIAYDGQKRSQQISRADLADFDYIFAMDEQNLADLLVLASPEQAEKISLLADRSVPDPWYTGDFEETYALVDKACQEWLQKLGGE